LRVKRSGFGPACQRLRAGFHAPFTGGRRRRQWEGGLVHSTAPNGARPTSVSTARCGKSVGREA